MAEEQLQGQQPQVTETTESDEVSVLDSVLQKLDLTMPETLDIDQAVISEVEKEKLPAEIAVFLRWALQAEKPLERVDGQAVQSIIDNIDTIISSQLSEIFHNEQFQKMESSWRSLKFLVENTNFRNNIKIDLVNVSKEDLRDDFNDAPEIPQSGLYKRIYAEEYDTHGGTPYTSMIGNFEFDRGAQDIDLLGQLSKVAAASHCPFVSSVGKDFFGFKDISEIYSSPYLPGVFEQIEFTKWKSFRESEDSRYVGLCLPRFLLRRPYGLGENEDRIKAFNFSEGVKGEQHDRYLWGNAAFVMAHNIVRSHDKYGWPVNIVGVKSGGEVADLPLHIFEEGGEMVDKCPTETTISDTNELALSNCGLIPLVHEKNSDRAVFFGAQTARKPTKYDKPEATASEKLSAKLFNILMHARFSHYLKKIQRRNVGAPMEAPELEAEMNTWLNRYVTADPTAPLESRAKYPLKWARAQVEAIEDDPGWYRVQLDLRPWFKLEGMEVNISLVSKEKK